MGCHPDALIRLVKCIQASSRVAADHYLDQWIDYTTRATEWDADQWGFPVNWMEKERLIMDARAEMYGG